MQCQIIKDDAGGLFILPGCDGCVHHHAETRMGLLRIIATFCTCDRRPRYRRGEKQRAKRLEYRIRKLQERLAQIEDEAADRAFYPEVLRGS